MSQEYDCVMGLEVHIQLNTASKLFSAAPASFGAEPNSQANLIDLAYPGTLPVVNKEALRQAIIFGLAVNASICPQTVFARKNYFYPDLPKGYQTTQSDKPIVSDGYLDIESDGVLKKIYIVRAHLEEDAGKSMHDFLPGSTVLDLNRAGSVLLEIVTAPDFSNAQDVISYLKTLHRLVRYLGICDGNMQEGSFRVDVNVSLKPKGSPILGTRCEIKNINSFKFIEKAIAFEIERQSDLLNKGQAVRQQTRLFQESTGTTVAMRDKENSHDYRYFPCPDLRPITISQQWIDEIATSMPKALVLLEQDLKSQGLSTKESDFLLDNPEILLYYQEVLKSASKLDPKGVINLLLSEYLGLLKKSNVSFEEQTISSAVFAKIAQRNQDGTLSSKTTKQLLVLMMSSQEEVDSVIEKAGLRQISDSGVISGAIDQVISLYPSQCQEFKDGKEKILPFLVGQVMKLTQGAAAPAEIQKLLKEKLS